MKNIWKYISIGLIFFIGGLISMYYMMIGKVNKTEIKGKVKMKKSDDSIQDVTANFKDKLRKGNRNEKNNKRNLRRQRRKAKQ